MIKHTIDDGSSRKKNDLTDVRIRSIKRIKPRKKTPRFGEPEVIEEFFYDFKLKKKALVLRTENSFNSKGLVEEKRIYDGQKELQSELSFKYDENDHIKYSKDAIGRVTEFEWDENGRMVMKKALRYITKYTYDIRGLLIKEEEIWDNGNAFATHYEYDMLTPV